MRLSATVILARSTPKDGLEVYMTRRSAGSAFAPDAYVFPGGVVDPVQDTGAAILQRARGVDARRVQVEFDRAEIPLGLPCDVPPVTITAAQSLLLAALRELFEEAGILIGTTASDIPIDAATVLSQPIAAERAALRDSRITFATFLQRRNLFADARELTLFSHWITPPSEPRRYNTHFFFAQAPEEQSGTADAFETHDGLWIAPADALTREAEGAFHLVYPTRKHLERLTAFDSLAQARQFVRSKRILTILPTTTADGGFAMPPALEDMW